MKAIHDPAGALAAGMEAIKEQFQLPRQFPPAVQAAAEAAAERPLNVHRDRTGEAFVTLDPQSSRDLDQAFRIEAADDGLLLHYAIADVDWFVADGDPVDLEAWTRGESIYLPGDKVPLYPKVLSEGAASLLPGDDRPAIVFAVRVDAAGEALFEGAERAVIRSRAKLAYRTVRESDLPPAFAELSRRIAAAERARGAARIDPPQQEVEALPGGRYALGFRPMSAIEQDNASLSLATNLALGRLLLDHRTGLFRVMAEPGKRAVKRLRHTAKALGIHWPSDMDVAAFERGLDPNIPAEAKLMLAARRSGEHAGYAAYEEGETPWHSAVAATYVHATAPLRRLADRYVCRAALALAKGDEVDPETTAAFAALPKIMAKADSKAAQVESAAIELAEAVVLKNRQGEEFEARVTEIDRRGAKVQLCHEPVMTRLKADALEAGDRVRLRLVEAIPTRRLSRFELA